MRPRAPRTDLPDEVIARARRVLQGVEGGSIARIADGPPVPTIDRPEEVAGRPAIADPAIGDPADAGLGAAGLDAGDQRSDGPAGADPTASAAAALGLDVVEVSVGELVRRSRDVRPHAVDAAKRRLVRDHTDLERVPVHDIDDAIRVELVLRTQAHRHGWRGIAAECSPEDRTVVGLAACAAVGWEADRGLAVACEGDVLGSALHAVLVAATGEPPFLGHLARVDGTDEVTLWHCGGSAGAQRPVTITGRRSRAEVVPARVTLARLGVLPDGRAALVVTAGDLVDGPTASWRQGASVRVRPDFEVDRLEGLLGHLDHGHRLSMVHGDHTDLLEAVAGVAGLLLLEP
jgi:hypothetical protein